MGKRSHPTTDKVARPLAWRVEQVVEEVVEEVIEEVIDAPTVPRPAGPRVALRIPGVAVPPRIAGTPSPAARGSSPLITSPFGQPVFAPPLPRPRQPLSPRSSQPLPPRSSPPLSAMSTPAPVSLAAAPGRPRDARVRVGYFLAGAGVAIGLVLYGKEAWQLCGGTPGARPIPAAVAPVAAAPAAPAAPAVIVPLASGRLELSADHRAVTRLAGDATTWTAAPLPPLASLEVTGPIALGRTDFTAAADQTLVAIDLATGVTRFSWTPPADERWATRPAIALGRCLLATTARSHRLQLRCLDLGTGELRWTAALAASCSQPPTAVPGSFVVPCSGATAIIDERTGATSLCRAAGGGCSTSKPARR